LFDIYNILYCLISHYIKLQYMHRVWCWSTPFVCNRKRIRDYMKLFVEILLAVLILYTIYSFYEDQVCI